MPKSFSSIMRSWEYNSQEQWTALFEECSLCDCYREAQGHTFRENPYNQSLSNQLELLSRARWWGARGSWIRSHAIRLPSTQEDPMATGWHLLMLMNLIISRWEREHFQKSLYYFWELSHSCQISFSHFHQHTVWCKFSESLHQTTWK